MRVCLRTRGNHFLVDGMLSGSFTSALHAAQLQSLLSNPAITLIVRDAKAELRTLRKWGYGILAPIHDVEILAHLTGWTSKLPGFIESEDLQEEADSIHAIYESLSPRVFESEKLRDLYLLETCLARVLLDIEERGIRVDPSLLDDQLKRHVKEFDGKSVIQPRWNPYSATGRMASHSPCSTNIPKSMRVAFIPWDENYILVCIDLSQIELRWLAELSQDKALLTAFVCDMDVHTQAGLDLSRASSGTSVAHLAMNDPEWRQIAKAVSFSIVFGGGPTTIAKATGLSVPAASRYLRRWLAKYPGVAEWQERETEKLHKRGECETWFGRRRSLPGALLGEARALRQGINHLVQGSAADQFKHIIVRLSRLLHGTKSWMQNFIHDEIQIQLHRSDEELLPRLLAAVERWPQLSVPIKAKVQTSAESWAAM